MIAEDCTLLCVDVVITGSEGEVLESGLVSSGTVTYTNPERDGAVKFIPWWKLPPVVELEPRLDVGAGGFHVYIC